MTALQPPGTYRPQYRVRWRGLARGLDRFPAVKRRLANGLRAALGRVFAPGLVTTERILEYPFVFQNLDGVAGRILDIGCVGSGLTVSLASRGFRVVGVDYNPYPFVHPNLSAARADAMRLPFRSASFGVVLAVSVVEHIGIGHYGDPEAERGDLATVREIARVIRPGGRALITVPFGVPWVSDFQRVYDPAGLAELVAPLRVERLEHARSHAGLWVPCVEAEAALVDWRGLSRAVALVVAGPR